MIWGKRVDSRMEWVHDWVFVNGTFVRESVTFGCECKDAFFEVHDVKSVYEKWECVFSLMLVYTFD